MRFAGGEGLHAVGQQQHHRRRIAAMTASRDGSPRAISFGRLHTAVCRRRRYSVLRLIRGRPRYRCSLRTVHGLGRSSGAASRVVSRPAPSLGRPLRGRSSRPAPPLELKRAIHRRTVAGPYSDNTAMCAGGRPGKRQSPGRAESVDVSKRGCDAFSTFSTDCLRNVNSCG